MEWSIQKSLDGQIFLNCDAEFSLLSDWIEFQLNQDAQFAHSLRESLLPLQGLERFTMERSGFRFTANNDEVILEGNQADWMDEGLYEESLSLVPELNQCGYDDFLALLDSIIDYL